MSEGRPKLRLVGGTDYKPERSPEPERSENVSPDMLIKQWVDVVHQLPADFALSVNERTVEDALKQIRAWTVADLYTYLNNRSEIWKRPSFTRAVLDETNIRIQSGTYTPRA